MPRAQEPRKGELRVLCSFTKLTVWDTSAHSSTPGASWRLQFQPFFTSVPDFSQLKNNANHVDVSAAELSHHMALVSAAARR